MSVNFKKIQDEAEQRKKDSEAINKILKILHSHNLKYVEDLEEVFSCKEELESKIETLKKVINILIKCFNIPLLDEFVWREDLNCWEYSDWTYSIMLDNSTYTFLKEELIYEKIK